MHKVILALLGMGSMGTIAWYVLRTDAVPEAITPTFSKQPISASSISPVSVLLSNQEGFPEIGQIQNQSKQRTSGDSRVPTHEVDTASPKPVTRQAARSPSNQPALGKNYWTESDEYRALTARQMNLEDAFQLRELATDPSPLVREAALERLRQLEGEYEMETHIERQPGEPGQFISTVLDALNTESDPFAIKSGLDYLGEYGENDPSAAQTLEQMLQRPDLSATALMQIAELFAENYGLSPEQVRQLLLGSPSVGQLLDGDLNSLANPQSDEDSDSTVPGDNQSSEPRT